MSPWPPVTRKHCGYFAAWIQPLYWSIPRSTALWDQRFWNVSSRSSPAVSLVVLSANRDPEMIFRASKLGADDYISKPVDLKELDMRIAKVLDNQRLYTEVTQLREQVRRQSDFTMLFGTSPKMMEVKMTIEQVADTTATVLIRGESGTGKEVVARMVYSESSRSEKAVRQSELCRHPA